MLKVAASDGIKSRIEAVELDIFEWPDIPSAAYGIQNAPTNNSASMGLVTIRTEDGLVGHSFLGSSFRPVDIDARALTDVLRPRLIGRDAFAREELQALMVHLTKAITFRPIGAVDVALWDLAGKAAGLPVHRMLGTARDKIPTYASSPTFDTVEQYIEEVQSVREQGYRGYKIHPPHDERLHIPICKAVREAVGNEYPLMFDASMVYTYEVALKVGLALQDLGYEWYEDPLPVDDLFNYPKLCAELRIPVMATEYAFGGFHGFTPWILERATDALRGDVAIKGGITPIIKAAHLAEAFRLPFELHHGGNSVNNFANLQVAHAIHNCKYFEVLLPHGAQKYGVIDDIEIDRDGFVAATDRPGIGAQIDFDLIKKRKLASI